MLSRAHDPQRWLCLATALLSLFLGTGVHEWLHSSGATADSGCVTQQVELHSGNCEHHGPPASGHRADCPLCKTGSRQVTPPPVERTPIGRPLGGRISLAQALYVARASVLPGVLGARAPPVTLA